MQSIIYLEISYSGRVLVFAVCPLSFSHCMHAKFQIPTHPTIILLVTCPPQARLKK